VRIGIPRLNETAEEGTVMETKTFDGRNGTIILNADRVAVGKVLGRLYGFQRSLMVSVDIRVERLERLEKYPTIHHGEMSQPLNFSIISTVWNPGATEAVAAGRGTKAVTEVATAGMPMNGFTRGGLLELAAFGERWNRNDLNAACAHQKVKLRGHHLTADACPETGYRYGQGWLLESLPSGFMATLSGFLATASPDRVYVLS